jgi:hypothetical protein
MILEPLPPTINSSPAVPKQGLLDESHDISPAACAVEKFENRIGDEGNIRAREVGIVIASIVIFCKLKLNILQLNVTSSI